MVIKNCNFVRRLAWVIHPQVNKQKFSTSIERVLPQKSSSTFSEEEETVILGTINKCNASDFQRFDIKEGQLKKLLAQREKTGKFENFDDVLMSQDVAPLIKFCKSILTGGKKQRTNNRSTGAKNVVVPAMTDEARCEMKNVMGLHVWGNVVSWTLLDTSGNVNLWDFERLDSSKMNVGGLVDLVTELTLQLPLADAYVMESDVYSSLGKLKASAYQVHLQRQQIIAVIISGIKMKQCITNQVADLPNNFYFMQARYPARLFNLNLGTETVSGGNVVSKIISDRQSTHLPHVPSIEIDSKIIDKYNSYDIASREQLHSVLLLTLAFYGQIYVDRKVKTGIKMSS